MRTIGFGEAGVATLLRGSRILSKTAPNVTAHPMMTVGPAGFRYKRHKEIIRHSPKDLRLNWMIAFLLSSLNPRTLSPLPQAKQIAIGVTVGPSPNPVPD